MIPYTSSNLSLGSINEWNRRDKSRVRLLTGPHNRRPLTDVELFNQQLLYRMENEPSTSQQLYEQRDSLQTTAGRSSTSSVSYGYAVRNGHLMAASWLSLDNKSRRTKRSASTPSRYRRRPSFRYNAHGGFLAEQSYQIRPLLTKTAHKWSFDVFQLTAVSDGTPCMQLGLHIADVLEWKTEFGIDMCNLRTCLRLIEMNYRRRNCYHSAIHAADVTQAVFAFMHEKQVSWMTPMDKLAVILAAFGHDIRHPGVNQTFLTNSGHFLSTLYGNMSVLENFHWRCLMSILRESQLLEHFSADQWRRLSDVIRQIILATDMLRQPMYIDQLQTLMRRQSNNSKRALTKDNRLLVMQCMVKCADISNPCRPWRLSQEWSYRASTEFFAQGDKERLAGYAVTSSCDRQATSIPKIQSGFMQFVARPLFNTWNAYMSSMLSATLMQHLDENQQRWEELTDDVDSDKQKTRFSIGVDTSIDTVDPCSPSPRGRRGSSLPLTSAYLLQSGAHLVIQQLPGDKFTSKIRTQASLRAPTNPFKALNRRRVSLPARQPSLTRMPRVHSNGTKAGTYGTDVDTFLVDDRLVEGQVTTVPSTVTGGRRHSEPVTMMSVEQHALMQTLYLQQLTASGAGPRRSSLPVSSCQFALLKREGSCHEGSRGSIA